MKKCLVMVLLAAMLSGCFGSFGLTRKLWNWNKNIGGKAGQELAYLALIILPVYSITTFVDFFFINTIEFWTDENPMDSKVLEKGDEKVVITYQKETDTMRMDLYKADKFMQTLVLEKSKDGVTARDLAGQVLYRATTDDKGGVSVLDARGETLGYYPSAAPGLAQSGAVVPVI